MPDIVLLHILFHSIPIVLYDSHFAYTTSKNRKAKKLHQVTQLLSPAKSSNQGIRFHSRIHDLNTLQSAFPNTLILYPISY